jgi:hypothetical protein
MKRFWLVLLSLGLIVAFSTSAMAVDVKFGGEYYAAGMYLDRTALKKEGTPSTAFYFQRLRLSTTFIVHPGLMLITRADIMERAWGAPRSAPVATLDTLSAGSRAENENIAFDLLYAMYVSPVGIFLAGYQIDGAWGTTFGDSSMPTPKIGYMFRGGPVTAGIQMGKNPGGELSATAINATTASDRDNSFYTIYGIFAWKTGQVGLLGKYIRVAGTRDPGLGAFQTNYYILTPYAKAQLGPVAVQAQLYYLFGNAAKFDGATDDIKASQLSAWVDATADFGMFYAGGSLAYISGDDPGTADKREGGTLSGGQDWNPCLIMFNNERTYWAGSLAGYGATANAGPMSNAYFGQLRVGVRPVDKLDIMGSVSYAHADKTLAGATWEGRDYGYEVDLTATYKITNNLSYMLGGGYLFVGKYYKASTSANNDLQNNFMVINKLTLTF